MIDMRAKQTNKDATPPKTEAPKAVEEAENMEVETDVSGNVTPRQGTKRKETPTIDPISKKAKDNAGNAMEVDSGPGGAPLAAKATAGGATGESGAQETPVDIPPRIQGNFFSETCTVSLPLVCYLSSNTQNKNSANVLRIRMNTPNEVLGNTTLVQQTKSVAKAKGISNTNSQELSAINHLLRGEGQFPTTIVGATAKSATTSSYGVIADNQCRPARRLVYDKVYDAYHVIACKWKITMENTSATCTNEVFYQFDTVTASSISDMIPTNRESQFYRTWPRVKSVIMGPRNSGNSENNWRKEISGVWMPGQLHKNTVNSTDIKTWSPTNAVPPNTWREELVLLFFAGENTLSDASCSTNMRIDLEYIVQYKDLKLSIRYPHRTDTVQNLIVYPLDSLQQPLIFEDVI